MIESNLHVALAQVVEYYPVSDGDLVSKADKVTLAQAGFIWRKTGNGKSNVSDGERLGGWCPTEEGLAVYEEIMAAVPNHKRDRARQERRERVMKDLK